MKYKDVSEAYPSLSRQQKLIIVHGFIKELVSLFKIAPTPSYIEIDYGDIEDSQIIASAKAVDALVLTRDQKMLQKYPDLTIHPSNFQLPTSNSSIDFANLKKQYFMYLPELHKEMGKVLNSAAYIMGDAVKKLEENLQEFTGAKHAITCSSGTDALLLAMMALEIKPGDEIITTPFTFIATAETIALL
ncbi:MAG: aminotransferase class I/II-fold pyridoxal phosphate-dependent enzyme, partial [Sulfurovum sp.]|nr:aminotransferase class I/II-fold pyridoxal phosphate-dependent enzyme [Sulfurovum sp.]